MSGISPTGGGALAGGAEGALIGTMILPGIGTAIGAGIGALGGAYLGHKVSESMHNNTPKLTAPQTQTAAQPVAATTAIQTSLAKEQNARSTGSILTSPAGLNDEPTTTSSLLTGA